MSGFCFCQLEHEILGESFPVPLDLLAKSDGLHSVQFRQIAIEHDLLSRVTWMSFSTGRRAGKSLTGCLVALAMPTDLKASVVPVNTRWFVKNYDRVVSGVNFREPIRVGCQSDWQLVEAFWAACLIAVTVESLHLLAVLMKDKIRYRASDWVVGIRAVGRRGPIVADIVLHTPQSRATSRAER
jgi:hypothetical protein